MAQSTMHSLGGVVVPPNFFQKSPLYLLRSKEKGEFHSPLNPLEPPPTEMEKTCR
jgi:hypothetical protein